MAQGQLLPDDRRMSPSFVAVIISGVGLFVGLIGHIVSISLPIWFSRGTGLFDSPRDNSWSGGRDFGQAEPGVPGWLHGVRGLEVFGLLLAIFAAILFVIILVRYRSLRSSLPLLVIEKLAVLGFVAALFFASFFIILGMVVIFTRSDDGGSHRGEPSLGVFISGTCAISFLTAAGLAGKAAADIILYRQ